MASRLTNGEYGDLPCRCGSVTARSPQEMNDHIVAVLESGGDPSSHGITPCPAPQEGTEGLAPVRPSTGQLEASTAPQGRDSLTEWMAFLKTEDCPCPYEWKQCIGRLHGISMGSGWVRMDTYPECPHHGGGKVDVR